MITFDASEYIKGLQQLLISDKKRIGFLFGAGTSLAKKNKSSLYVPAIGKMTSDIVENLSQKDSYKIAIDEIIKELGDQFTIETLLSNLEQKKKVIGTGTLNKLNRENFDDLCKSIKEAIRSIVSVHENLVNIEDIIHYDFATWINRAERKYPVEIFTTNYDYLFELGLEHQNVPYYDGFTGSFKPFFNSESIEDMGFLPQQTKLWKIHGSLGWHYDERNKKVWRKDSDNEDILIYPSSLKYDESKKQPYTALGDRLTNFLKQPDSVLITCGYSFGDEHINERILTALKTNLSAHVFVLLYDILWINKLNKKYTLTQDSHLARIAMNNRKLSVFATRNAVIGGKYGKWKLKKEPDKDDTINVNVYYDEDAPTMTENTENWTGEGELKIPDFKFLVAFLQSMMYNNILTDL